MLDVEHKKELLGCDTSTCMAEVGGALGAKLVLYGDVGVRGSQNVVSLNALDTHSAQVRARLSHLVPANGYALAAAVPSLVAGLRARLR